jgi:hypothetical protein
MIVTERRVVLQEWYRTETTKTGWGSHGWSFDDGCQIGDDWCVFAHIDFDKSGNPLRGIAQREVIC